MALTITSANAQLTFAVGNNVFPIPQIIQGFAVDDAFEVQSVKPNETRIGVDGRKSSGRTPYLVPFSVMLMPDSPSILTMDQWLGAMAAIGDDITCDGTLVIPGIQKIYTLTNGTMSGAIVLPSGKKLLEAQKYEFEFESIVPGPFSL